MHITDLNGCKIEVTDLDKAIEVTTRYRQYEHLNDGFSKQDKQLNRYWTDMNEKLKKLQQKQNEIKKQHIHNY